MTRGVFVTGTDTGVGKTLASAALLHALRARGLRAVGMKPVASGCVQTADGWRNDDTLALLQASDPQPRYDDVNPYALPTATAPQLAARAGEFIADLPPAYRDVIWMYDVEEIPTSDIAETLQISIPALKSRLHRARLYVRQRLSEISRGPVQAEAQ